jgi:hypothetical protein
VLQPSISSAIAHLHEQHDSLLPANACQLLAGTYSSLPASIQDMRGPRALPEAQQQRLVQHLNHLLYSQLLKVGLAACRKRWRLAGKGCLDAEQRVRQSLEAGHWQKSTCSTACAAAEHAQQRQGKKAFSSNSCVVIECSSCSRLE